MFIDIYSGNGALFEHVIKVLSCSVVDKLNGERTLSFSCLLEGKMTQINDNEKYYIEFENDLYDIVKIQKSLQNGLYLISFSCEHISYRLTDYHLGSFEGRGTLRELLLKLLKNTNFTLGEIPATEVKTYTTGSTSTVKAVLFDLLELFHMEVKFYRYVVSVMSHRGSQAAKPLIDDNVLAISKQTTCSSGKLSYSCVLKKPDGFSIGDEVMLKFDKLGINEQVRIMGMRRQPFVSDSVEIIINAEKPSIERDMVDLEAKSLSQEKDYYGVNISSEEGLTVTRKDEKARVVLNADEFRMQSIDEDGNYQDKLFFDPDLGEYRFAGNVSVDGGSIDIGGKFQVDTQGNVHMTGESTIYGGKYYAGNPEKQEGFSQMTSGGFEVYNADKNIKLRFGYTTEGEDYPFIQLGSGSGAYTDYGLVKKFDDGLWIGNSEPSNESGVFVAKLGYNGIFFRFSDNMAFIVKNSVMKNIYTGTAIARFG